MAEVEVMARPPAQAVSDQLNDVPSPSRSESPPSANDPSTTLTITKADDAVTTYINEDGKKVRKIIRKKRRPARPQVDPSTFKNEPPPQTGTIFNIVSQQIIQKQAYDTC